jgi:hypothetical protein
MGQSRLTAQLVATYQRTTASLPYRAGATLQQLAQMFVDRGQSLQRAATSRRSRSSRPAWFNYPTTGGAPDNNNFAGIVRATRAATRFRSPGA